MARRITPAQYKQMVAKYNREVKRHNQKVQRDIDNYNREIRKHNQAEERRIRENNRLIEQQKRNYQKAVNSYNQQVRKFNRAQLNKRNELNSAIRKFNQSSNLISSTSNSIILKASTETLERSYRSLSDFTGKNELENSSTILLDHPVQETKNSIDLFNSINGIDQGEYISPSTLQMSIVESSLFNISDELGKRWAGALYSLNPKNPDAARHFCTSVREIFIQLIDLKAPDNIVLETIPSCNLHNGRPNRRSKIQYLLKMKSMNINSLEQFIDDDVNDLLTFFKTLNDGTHGGAGKFSVQQLLKIKKRAEDSIIFISAL